MTTIDDVFEIPDSVQDGDFVLKLTEGVSRPDTTLSDYVVTPQLASSFGTAMTAIRKSLESGSSSGVFLHGSFGSGKSHFMAVLSLLLERNQTARALPELADVVRDSNAWLDERRILVVPYHMIGEENLESAILGGYARFIRKHHPEAPTPGFYQSEGLFRDAQGIRDAMGDAPFFAKLNHASAEDDGWGALGAGWDTTGFEHAIAAAPGDAGRDRLVGDLKDTFFAGQRDAGQGSERYSPIDEGLSILSHHAKAQGYAGIVLFLDELILWLAGHSGDMNFLQRETQKLVKLVEAHNANRPIPIISFVARQRDLRQLVGDHMPGAQQLSFDDTFQHYESRFSTITLDDRNLPLIAEKRLLRPQSDKAKALIDKAFESTAKVRREVFDILMTRDADRGIFRQVYPFTPALIQTLVAISSLLQRERTALKMMQQLLIDHRHRLKLGDVLPVGDLYDVIDTRDEPFSQAMKRRFDDARELFARKLIPVLEHEHKIAFDDLQLEGVVAPERRQQFLNDARLMKTLLLSALAENVDALRNLDANRLTALNHGTVNSPVPGRETQLVVTKLRRWAGEVGEIKVSDDPANPTVALQIVGLDTDGIIDNARSFDNNGNRIMLVRQILFSAFELDEQKQQLVDMQYSLQWRGTERTGTLLYDNVRKLSREAFLPPDESWRVVIDYPFDPETQSPMDDVSKVDDIRRTSEAMNTLVWLPSFLTPAAADELGKLVILEHLLIGTRLNEHASHISQSEREVARQLLASQRDALRQRIRNYLLTAYGITRSDLSCIDQTHDLGNHFLSLNPGFTPATPNGAEFKSTLDSLLDQAWSYSHPKHPQFPMEIRRPMLNRSLDAIRSACQISDRRLEIEQKHRPEIRAVVVPLNLANMDDTHLVMRTDFKEEFMRRMHVEGVTDLTVGQLRQWCDEGGQRGLRKPEADLVIITFALQSDRAFFLHGGPVEPKLGDLNDKAELRAQALPSQTTWDAAIDRAGRLFGFEGSRVLSARNVAALEQELKQRATDLQSDVHRLADALAQRLALREIDSSAAERLTSARSTAALLSDLHAVAADQAIDTLAEADIATSATSVSDVIGGASGMLASLENTKWGTFDELHGLSGEYQQDIDSLSEQVDAVLCADEHVIPLSATLRQVEDAALALLVKLAKANAVAQATAKTAEAVAGSNDAHTEDAASASASTSDSDNAAALDATAGSPLGLRGQLTVPIGELDAFAARLRTEFADDPEAEVDVSWSVSTRQ